MKKDRELHAKETFAGHRISNRVILNDMSATFTLRPTDPKALGQYVEVCSLGWGNLLVYGDWFPVMFGCYSGKHWRGKLDWIGRSNLDYVWEKARIGSGRSWETDDPDEWKRDVLSYRKDKLISQEGARAVMSAVADEDWHEARKALYEEDWELVQHAGLVVEWPVIMAKAAVTRLCDILDAEDKLTGDTL